MPPLRDEFLAMLRCPANRATLANVDAELLNTLNAAIASGRVRNVGGDAIVTPLEAALVRSDRRVVYPIVDGIPVMLIDEGISIEQLASTVS